jgi:hypothetical protein
MKIIVISRIDDPATVDQDDEIITHMAKDGYMLKSTSLSPGKRMIYLSTDKRCTRKFLKGIEDELQVKFNDNSIDVDFD